VRHCGECTACCEGWLSSEVVGMKPVCPASIALIRDVPFTKTDPITPVSNSDVLGSIPMSLMKYAP
jgi:hypothetical protein